MSLNSINIEKLSEKFRLELTVWAKENWRGWNPRNMDWRGRSLSSLSLQWWLKDWTNIQLAEQIEEGRTKIVASLRSKYTNRFGNLGIGNLGFWADWLISWNLEFWTDSRGAILVRYQFDVWGVYTFLWLQIFSVPSIFIFIFLIIKPFFF